jgi:hypothetical protein
VPCHHRTSKKKIGDLLHCKRYNKENTYRCNHKINLYDINSNDEAIKMNNSEIIKNNNINSNKEIEINKDQDIKKNQRTIKNLKVIKIYIWKIQKILRNTIITLLNKEKKDSHFIEHIIQQILLMIILLKI